jgi:hypothetical protein
VHDPEIIERDVCELRAASAISDCPYIGGSCFEALINDGKSARVQLDASQLEADVVGIGRPTSGNQDVGGLDDLRALRRLDVDQRAIAGPAPTRSTTPLSTTRMFSSPNRSRRAPPTSRSSRPASCLPLSITVTCEPRRRAACASSSPT